MYKEGRNEYLLRILWSLSSLFASASSQLIDLNRVNLPISPRERRRVLSHIVFACTCFTSTCWGRPNTAGPIPAKRGVEHDALALEMIVECAAVSAIEGNNWKSPIAFWKWISKAEELWIGEVSYRLREPRLWHLKGPSRASRTIHKPRLIPIAWRIPHHRRCWLVRL